MSDSLSIEQIIKQFALYGDLISFKGFGSGHINNTYVSTFNQGGIELRYTHQRINKTVFTKPNEVMENIVRVTEHIQNKLAAQNYKDISSRTLTVIPSKDGLPYYIDSNGDYWRTYLFIDHVTSYDVLSDASAAFSLGEAIGTFQNQLSDYVGPRLYDTIPKFHNMKFRYEQLEEALKQDPKNRAKDIQNELAFILENKERGMVLVEGLESGKLKEGITHNDTKINNLLFSEQDNSVLCVIDLDTVMPGTILFDTGDLIRTATITGAEDEQDLTKINFNFAMFQSLIKGYLSIAKSFLTAYEISLLAESGRNITQIMAVRFLTDYLNGDLYYKTTREHHNLDRARTQIKFIQSLDSQWQEIQTFIQEL